MGAMLTLRAMHEEHRGRGPLLPLRGDGGPHA